MRKQALHELMLDRALQGDTAARECVRDALAHSITAVVVNRFRNATILDLARWLRIVLNNPSAYRGPSSDYRLSEMIGAAGRALQTQRTLDFVPQLHSLTVSERSEMAERLRPLISQQSPWPGERQLRRIITDRLDIEPP